MGLSLWGTAVSVGLGENVNKFLNLLEDMMKATRNMMFVLIGFLALLLIYTIAVYGVGL